MYHTTWFYLEKLGRYTRWTHHWCKELLPSLGLTLWNLSCLEFKSDDTRLSYRHNNKIGRIENFFCCFLTLLIFCPVGLLNFAKGQLISKCLFWCHDVHVHQIWIPNNLGFMVLILVASSYQSSQLGVLLIMKKSIEECYLGQFF